MDIACEYAAVRIVGAHQPSQPPSGSSPAGDGGAAVLQMESGSSASWVEDVAVLGGMEGTVWDGVVCASRAGTPCAGGGGEAVVGCTGISSAAGRTRMSLKP